MGVQRLIKRNIRNGKKWVAFKNRHLNSGKTNLLDVSQLHRQGGIGRGVGSDSGYFISFLSLPCSRMGNSNSLHITIVVPVSHLAYTHLSIICKNLDCQAGSQQGMMRWAAQANRSRSFHWLPLFWNFTLAVTRETGWYREGIEFLLSLFQSITGCSKCHWVAC